MGCGSQGWPDVMWVCLAGLPARRKVTLPFVVTPAPAPHADLPARVRADCTDWLGSKRTLVLRVLVSRTPETLLLALEGPSMGFLQLTCP